MAHWHADQLFEQLYRPLLSWFDRHKIQYAWSTVATLDLTAEMGPTHSQAFGDKRGDKPEALWQDRPDSYAVWVSEVMLQQTRVETVLSYYTDWLQRWPSLVELAGASEEQVLKQWEGLGYYSRALNMLACARKCCIELGRTTLPNQFDELLSLPGIGPYIAAAVASISGNEAVLAVDTNVKRIFSRLYQQQPTAAAEKSWRSQHLPALRRCAWRGAANLALIQLGQQLCRSAGKSRTPICCRCPLQGVCPAAASGNWISFPAPRSYSRQLRQSRRLLLCANGHYLLQRKRSGHLRHLWRLPQLAELGIAELSCEYLGSFTHAYLQTQEKVQVFACESNRPCSDWPLQDLQQEFAWLWTENLEELTLAGPYRSFLDSYLRN